MTSQFFILERKVEINETPNRDKSRTPGMEAGKVEMLTIETASGRPFKGPI